MEIAVSAQARTQSGKGPARRARAGGMVPGVLYGRSIEPMPLSVDERQLAQALHTEAGANVLINLSVGAGNSYLTMLREVQRHPVRGHLVHVDFVSIARDIKVQADVPVHLTGTAQGVKEGGVIEHHLWEVKVASLPGALPPHFEIDISAVGIGGHVKVSDIAVAEGVEMLSPAEEIVASIVEPQVREVAPAAEAEAVAEGAPAEAAEAAE